MTACPGDCPTVRQKTTAYAGAGVPVSVRSVLEVVDACGDGVILISEIVLAGDAGGSVRGGIQ